MGSGVSRFAGFFSLRSFRFVQEIYPSLACADVINSGLAYTVILSQCLLSDPAFLIPLTNRSHLPLGEFGFAILFSIHPSVTASLHGICSILFGITLIKVSRITAEPNITTMKD